MKRLKYFSSLCALIIVFAIAVNLRIAGVSRGYIYTRPDEVPAAYTAIVLGAMVSKTGNLSNFLLDRMDMALALYNAGKVKRFLLSGDHGRADYDEVNSMKHYLLDHGVDSTDIFLDHAGFDTYNTMVRAKEIFGVEDAIIISQEFHVPRAVYIARGKGIQAYGINADKRDYGSLNYLKFRESIACIKAFFEVNINKSPVFLGDKIPISGDSRLSYD